MAQSSAPLLLKADLIYEGAFRVPQGSSETESFSWGGTALSYNPINDSLYLVGHDWEQESAEISIPQLLTGSDAEDLNTASFIQPLRDATEGRLRDINPSDPNPQKIGGHLVHDGKLIVTGYSFYDGQGSQNSSHFSRPLSLSDTGQLIGPVSVGFDAHFVSGHMAPIPPEWQGPLGGPALSGNCCLSITGYQSNGPSVSVFDPSRIGQVNPVPATLLVGYPFPIVLGPGETTTNDYFNLATKISGVVFPDGTRSVLFFGRHGKGEYCYGSGPDCGDPAEVDQGTHAWPYAYQVWAYDANDLLDVKNNGRAPDRVEPYAIWNFNLPYEWSDGSHLLGGAAFDSGSGRIYLSQLCADSECRPIIHAFQVQGATQITVPSPPTSLNAE